MKTSATYKFKVEPTDGENYQNSFIWVWKDRKKIGFNQIASMSNNTALDVIKSQLEVQK